MKDFRKLYFYLASLIISLLLSGFVLMKLWAWFIANTFHINPLSLVQSIGMTIFIGWLTMNKTKREKTDLKDDLKKLIEFIVMCILMLSLGWIVSLFY